MGASYEVPIADNDSITFALEYFHNDLGYTDTVNYPFVLLGGGYQPFHLSRHYGMFMIYLPEPGHWNDVTFTLSNIVNLSDGSALTRVDTLFELMDDLDLNLAFGVHFGKDTGELRLGGQLVDIAARLMIQF